MLIHHLELAIICDENSTNENSNPMMKIGHIRCISNDESIKEKNREKIPL